MHDIQTQVLSVNAIPSQDGNSIRHVVALSGGQAADGTQYPPQEYVTFDGPMGAKAQSLMGQVVSARVSIKQKPKRQGGGFFTNYVLEDIGVPGSLQPMAMPAAGGTPAVAAPVQQPAPAIQPQPVTPHPHPLVADQEAQKSEERRRSAMHAAFSYVGSCVQAGMYQELTAANGAAVQLTKDLVRYIGTGSFEQAPASPEPPQQAQTAEEIAAAVPGVQLGAPAAPPVPFDQPQTPPAA